MNPPVHRQFGLDLIRALAIGMVVLSHFSRTVDGLGFWGVELFFGLSGYLIGAILWRNFSTTDHWTGAQLVNFWSRRWWRTLPSYYLFLPLYFIAATFFSPGFVSLRDVPRFLWFGQKLLAHANWFYGVSWSLCIEEWFYLLFPLLLFGLSRFDQQPKRAFWLAILLTFMGCFVVRQLLLQHGAGSDLRVITLGRLDAIACGVLVTFVTILVNPTPQQRVALFGVGLCLLAFTLVWPLTTGLSLDDIKRNTYLLVLTPLGGALLLPYCSGLPRPTGRLAPLAQGIECISLWSYSIYLSHSVVFETLCGLQDMYHLDSLRVLRNLPVKLFALGVVIPLSALLYRYFEVPLTQKRPAEIRLPRKHPVSVSHR